MKRHWDYTHRFGRPLYVVGHGTQGRVMDTQEEAVWEMRTIERINRKRNLERMGEQ